MLSCRSRRHWSDLSRAQARAKLWRTWDAQSTGPPSRPCWWSPTERPSRYSWYQFGCRSCREVSLCENQPPSGLHSRFSVGGVSLSLCHSRDSHKAVVLFAHSWGLFCVAPGRVHAPVGLHSTHSGQAQGGHTSSLCYALVDTADGREAIVTVCRDEDPPHRTEPERGYVLTRQD